MPLGFKFLPSPDQENRCDLTDCSVSSNVPWKVFEACWHSYHLECLIENAISSFSLAANRSFNLLRNSSNDENINEGEQGLGSGDRNDHGTAADDDDLPISTMNAIID